jgi:hypothetical protein
MPMQLFCGIGNIVPCVGGNKVADAGRDPPARATAE